jgi:isoleucyl-tRNA synthetase
MSPFLPFLTEAIYRNLVAPNIAGAPESVHLNSFPAPRAGLTDSDLELKMHLVRQAVAMGRALRSRFVIKTRQPLQEFTIIVRDTGICALLKDMEQLIREELNVKAVRFDTREEVVVSIAAKANFKKLGKLFGASMKTAAAQIEAFTSEQIRTLENGGTITVATHEITFDDIEIRRTKREGVEVETGGELTVALDTVITDALRTEGVAREFVNRVQSLRKDRQFQVNDRIVIRTTAPAPLAAALRDYRDYICVETLATDILILGAAQSGMETVDVEGYETAVDVTVVKQ